MIYVVTSNESLKEKLSMFQQVSAIEAVGLLEQFGMLQFDSKTIMKDPHLGHFAMIQFGSLDKEIQVIVDAASVDPRLFKRILETKYLVGHNLKFDLQFLFQYRIMPTHVFDTMIVDQLLTLGYPSAPNAKQRRYNMHIVSHSLKDVAYRRLGIILDRSAKGRVYWSGLDEMTVRYAANDVAHLGDIMDDELAECRINNCVKAAKLECDVVPALAYMEWCGIKLDKEKWQEKMLNDIINKNNAKAILDSVVVKDPKLSRFVQQDLQGDLWSGFDTAPKATVNWDDATQVVAILKQMGFTVDKNDDESGDLSIKQLRQQAGINEVFINALDDYLSATNAINQYGEKWLNSINPKTNRLHTQYHQLGAITGRITCGSDGPDADVTSVAGVKPSETIIPNLQGLPGDPLTRSCFVAEPASLFISCDYRNNEPRVLADISHDSELRRLFSNENQDFYSVIAWNVFYDECKKCNCTCVEDVRIRAKEWRDKAKRLGFAIFYGASEKFIQDLLQCSELEAKTFLRNLKKTFAGVESFAKNNFEFAKNNGWILINNKTGHRLYWPDHQSWKAVSDGFTPAFWDEYRTKHKGVKNDPVAERVSLNFRRSSEIERLCRDAPAQGTAACITKQLLVFLYKWIVKNNFFGLIKIVAVIHDEVCCEFPSTVTKFPRVLSKLASLAAETFLDETTVPVSIQTARHWVH